MATERYGIIIINFWNETVYMGRFTLIKREPKQLRYTVHHVIGYQGQFLQLFWQPTARLRSAFLLCYNNRKI